MPTVLLTIVEMVAIFQHRSICLLSHEGDAAMAELKMFDFNSISRDVNQMLSIEGFDGVGYFGQRCCSTIPLICSLARVVGGGSQNANEAYHSLLWTMVPKHRYCSSTTLRIGLGLSTIIYNEGYEVLNKIFKSIFLSVGYYFTECLRRLDVLRNSRTSKTKNKHSQRAKATTTVAASTASTETDNEITYALNEENLDFSVNDIALELDGIVLEQSDDDITDTYEAGGDD
ncbi:unnamed protein product [Didymodactylos carnosus]|uniref:Uncharacterized protein n=1 Tax=Didymodactylos carnosus TaxID=1234261 RepID=A0A815KBE7_9BILA|nr:unnamed protein product [Didymodactylos carnosus]CAF1478926.1 unnamed protein product [Didymodactylos carnosus]CAF4269800.1 unnamed protein product [Didymodactylos carnosus]CAF4282438.1 unnamed protein product [Didymodactylos carnosus]